MKYIINIILILLAINTIAQEVETQAIPEHFYYTPQGWAGPYPESDTVVLDKIEAICRAIIDEETQRPVEKRLVDLSDCNRTTQAKMKEGSALTQAQAEIEAEVVEATLNAAIEANERKGEAIVKSIQRRNALAGITVSDSQIFLSQSHIQSALTQLKLGALETARATLVELKANAEAMATLATITAPKMNAAYIDEIIAKIDN